MAYQVDYAPAMKRKPDSSVSFLRIAIFSLSFFLTFCMVVCSLWLQGREALGKLLFPGGVKTAMAAAEILVEELRTGAPVADALENFCQDVIYHGNLP